MGAARLFRHDLAACLLVLLRPAGEMILIEMETTFKITNENSNDWAPIV